VVVRFLSEIRTLYAMLHSLSKFPELPLYEEARSRAAGILIAYLRHSHRTDLYAKYVALLSGLHGAAGNRAEAATAQLLFADTLSWASAPRLPAVRQPLAAADAALLFPAQAPAARLEAVLVRGVRELAAAECWEEAARLLELLCARYEHATAEYSKLAAALRVRSQLAEQIVAAPRLFPSYFFVRYAGTAFPPELRGRLLVYRGAPGERIADFERRIVAPWQPAGAGPAAVKTPLRVSATRVPATPGAGAVLEPSSAVASVAVGAATVISIIAPRFLTEGIATAVAAALRGTGGGRDDDGAPEGAAAAAPLELSIASATTVAFIPLHPLYADRPLPLQLRLTDPASYMELVHAQAEAAAAARGGGGGIAAAASAQPPPASAFSVRGAVGATPRARSLPTAAEAAAAAELGGRGGLDARTSGDGVTLAAALHSRTGFARLVETARRPAAPAPAAAGCEADWLGSGDGAAAAAAEEAAVAAAATSAAASARAALAPLADGHEPCDAGCVPQLIRQGRAEGGARFFLHQRPFRSPRVAAAAAAGAKVERNDFLDLWIARSYVCTADAFPTTQRTSAAVFVHEVVLNPVEAAVLALREKNVALRDAIERAAAGPDRGADQELTSQLGGTVDAAVAGGVVNYAPFLTGTYARTHPEIAADLAGGGGGPFAARKAEALPLLRAVLLEQLQVVARGVRVHGVKCAENMLPMHEFLCSRFETMRRTVEGLVGGC